MADVLVCIKRVPDVSGQVLLSDDAHTVDARHVGFTVSPHEECAIELAVQIAGATAGTATVLTLGPADAVEQLRNALALGCADGVLIEAETEAYGPADVASAIADVVQKRAESGKSYDVILLGNDAADTGDFQVPIRLAYELDRPVVTGVSKCSVEGPQLLAQSDASGLGTEHYELPLPAVVAVMEGGVSPRYPSVPGRMKAKRAPVETLAPSLEPVGSGRAKLTLPPPRPGTVEILGRGPEAAPAVVDKLVEIGVVAS